MEGNTNTPASFEKFFEQIENSVNAHPKFTVNEEPCFHICRHGVNVTLWVSFKKQKKAREIHGNGTSVEEAVGDLIAGLDIYAEIFENKKSTFQIKKLTESDL